MATAQEQLMGMLNPQTARLLDNQMRQQQVAQRSQGAGMLSGLTQAYTGMADAVTGAAGLTPMGANEKKAIQASKVNSMQKEAVIANLSNNPDLTPKAILNITKAVNSGVMSVAAASKLGIPTGDAPKTREIEKGDKLITQEWDRANQEWVEVASSDIGAKEVAAAKVAADAAQKQFNNKKNLQFIQDNKERINKGMGAVEQSQKAIRTIDSAVDLLNKGVYTGSLTETRVQFIKLADLFGLDLGIDKASSTEEFGITLLDNLGPLVKSGMFGTGQSITNKDLEIAKSMIAGDPSKTEEAIRGILNKLYVGNQNSLKTTQEFMGEIAKIDSNYERFTISEEAIEQTQQVREFRALTTDNGYAPVMLQGVEAFADKKGRLFDSRGILIQTTPEGKG